jgi:hypothetical protein
MNSTPEENAQRKDERKKAEALVLTFQQVEPAMLKKAEQLVANTIRRHFPMIKGCALQSGHLKGKLTLEIVFDLTPGKASVRVGGLMPPPPVTTMEEGVVE